MLLRLANALTPVALRFTPPSDRAAATLRMSRSPRLLSGGPPRLRETAANRSDAASRTHVGPGHARRPGGLHDLLTAGTLLFVPPIAMDFDPRRGDVLDDVIVELARLRQPPSTFGAGVEPHVVMNRVWSRLGGRTHESGMLSLPFPTPVFQALAARRRIGLRTKFLLPPLQLDGQLGHLRINFDDPRLALRQLRCNLRQQFVNPPCRIIHDSRNVPSFRISGKTSLLNSYIIVVDAGSGSAIE